LKLQAVDLSFHLAVVEHFPSETRLVVLL
jgi:hypothetical protein